MSKRCTQIIGTVEQMPIKYCGGEMVTIETEATAQVKTRFCPKCGAIENWFSPGMIEKLMEQVVKVGEKEKPFYCELCGDEITKRDNYWIHVNTKPRHIPKVKK